MLEDTDDLDQEGVVYAHSNRGSSVSEPIIAASFVPLLAGFSDCFTAPSFGTFRHVIAGWLLCVGRHTTTRVIEAAGVVGLKHHTSFHRFFRGARWAPDEVGVAVLRLLLALVDPGATLVVAVDDTLARHTGKGISSAGMHRDALLSTATKVFFHFGHVWVVLALVVRVERWNKSFALPVLVRLYRSEKTCKKMGIQHQKKTELALELILKLRAAVPDREIIIVGDNGFANRKVLDGLPVKTCFVGRGIMNAAVFERPWARRPSDRGRARVRGTRLPTPDERARDPHAPWRVVRANIYGKPSAVQVQVFDALWQKRGAGNFVRFVLIRDWPGHDKDDVLICTDTTRSAEWVIDTYCQRWPLEVTFHWCKSKLGFEEPQNRTEQAVLRTAPISLWAYSLVLCWYLTVGEKTRSAALRFLPWYTSKKTPAFSDMLAAVRRETWRCRINDRAGNGRAIKKAVAPLLLAVGYG
jgi:hypothetical protein